MAAQLRTTWHAPVEVTAGGIKIKVAGRALKYGQHDPVVAAWCGKTVRVAYDPADLTSVRFYDPDHRLIGVAHLNHL